MGQQQKRTLSTELAEAMAATERARSELHEATVRLLQREADAEATRMLIEQAERAIPGAADLVGIKDMRRHVPLPRGGNGAGRPTKSNHPFPRAVGNVKGWAEQQGLSYSFVKAWIARGSTLKPIPRKWQVLLEKTYGIPADAWKGGIGQRE